MYDIDENKMSADEMKQLAKLKEDLIKAAKEGKVRMHDNELSIIFQCVTC